MADRKNICVLFATAVGDDGFVTRLGATEAKHATERCLNRIERAVAAHTGEVLAMQDGSLLACFERCDAGVLAASEMLDRIRSLPALSGMRQPVRIGLHYGIERVGGQIKDVVAFRRGAGLGQRRQQVGGQSA